MEPALFDPRHAVVLAAFSAAMRAPPVAGDGTREAVLAQLEAWALGDGALGWLPHSPVNAQGHTLALALAWEGGLSDGQWLRGWLDRHGADAVLGLPGSPAPVPGILAQWARQAREAGAGIGGGQLDILGVLVHAMAHATPERMLTLEEGLDACENLLLDAPMAVAKTHPAGMPWAAEMAWRVVDLRALCERAPWRWMWDLGGLPEDLAAAAVLCPSGRSRSLRDLAGLRRRLGGPVCLAPDSPSVLPERPAADAPWLAREWVLEPGLDLDTARARAWSCAVGAPGAFAALLDLLEPGGKAPLAARVRLVLAQRDRAGRSLAALILGRGEDDVAGVHWEEQHRGLVRRCQALGVFGPQDLMGAQGEGLLEQVLMARRQGWSNDALDCLRNMDKDLPAMAWVGTGSQQALVDDLIDALVPRGRFGEWARHYAHCLEKMGDGQAPRLAQAVLWSEFLGQMGSVARGLRHPATSPQGQRQPVLVPDGEAQALADHVARYGVLLAVGRQEWAQWRRMGLDEALAGAKPDERRALERAMAIIEAGVVARGMDLALEGVAVRTGPRL